MSGAIPTDQWMITKEDRAKHDAQFAQLNPVNGLITGEKVKPILMKSGLSTAVLGHIWGLADMNGDGKLDQKEYSIAIHLIRRKLQGADLPKTLPASLKADPAVASPVSLSPATSSPVTARPAATSSPPAPSPVMSPVVARPVVSHAMHTPDVATSGAPSNVRPTAIHGPPVQPPRPKPPVAAAVVEPPPAAPAPSHPAPPPESKIPCAPVPTVPVIPVVPSAVPAGVHSVPAGIHAVPAGVQAVPAGASSVPAGVPASHAATSVPITSPVTPTSGSQTPAGPEWAVTQAQMNKYGQLFNTIDRNKRGYLTGLEAKTVLSKTGIANKLLAQIWNLSDIDGDGRLTRDEFYVAMHFVEMVKAGKKLPATLPAEYVPPSFRKLKQQPAGAKKASGSTPAPPAAPTAPAPKPSADLLLLDDPFGMPPIDLPVPLMEQTVHTSAHEDSTAKKEKEATPPSADFSVNWGTTSAVEPPGETNAESSEAGEPATAVSEPVADEQPVEPESSQDSAQLAGPPQEVEEVHQNVEETNTEVKEEEIVNSVEEEEAEKQKQLELEKEKKEKELETERQNRLEMEIKKQQEAERQRQLEAEKQKQMELERQREVELEKQKQLEIEKQKQIEFEKQKRLEFEKFKQMELEKQRQQEIEKQKQIEREKEEQKRKIQEQKEAAQREAKRQRQMEWEHQRRDQLIVLKAREQNQIEQMEKDITKQKAHVLAVEKKKTELQSKLNKARAVLNDFTTTIEGMRTTRDQKLGHLDRIQHKMEECKRKLILAQQEKQLLDAQLTSCDQHLNDTYKVVINSCNKKKSTVDRLNEQLVKIEKDMTARLDLIETNNNKLADLKNQMNSLHQDVKTVQHTLIGKKQQWETRNQFSGYVASEEKQRKDYDMSEKVEGYLPYVAMYQFEARSADELSFQPGDVVWVRPGSSGVESGWMFGRLHGAEGCFPEAYVQIMEGSEPAVAELSNERLEDDQPMRIDYSSACPTNVESGGTIPTSLESPFVSVPSSLTSGQGRVLADSVRATALFNWAAKKDNHLSFNKDDIILVTELQDLWWFGELDGVAGWFPKSYVQLIDEIPEVTEIAAPEVYAAAIQPEIAEPVEAGAGELYVAIYDYVSDELGDLTFSQGEIINVTMSDGEWWSGTLDGRSGIFPANFVKKTEKQPATPAAPKEMEAGPKLTVMKKPEIATAIATYEATGPEQLSLQPGHLLQVRKKTDTGWWEGELQVRGQKRRIGWFPASYVKLLGQGGARHSADNLETGPKPQISSVPSAPPPEQMLAMYDYQSQCDDELSFVKGDIITVISKQHPDWWNGELAGKIGIFPANFVGPIEQSSYPDLK